MRDPARKVKLGHVFRGIVLVVVVVIVIDLVWRSGVMRDGKERIDHEGDDEDGPAGALS